MSENIRDTKKLVKMLEPAPEIVGNAIGPRTRERQQSASMDNIPAEMAATATTPLGAGVGVGHGGLGVTTGSNGSFGFQQGVGSQNSVGSYHGSGNLLRNPGSGMDLSALYSMSAPGPASMVSAAKMC